MSKNIVEIAKKAKTVTQAAARLGMTRGLFKTSCLSLPGGEKVFANLIKRGLKYRTAVRLGNAPRIQQRYDTLIVAGQKISYKTLLETLQDAGSAAEAAEKLGIDKSSMSRLRTNPLAPPAIRNAYNECVLRGHKRKGNRTTEVDFSSESEAEESSPRERIKPTKIKHVCCGACKSKAPAQTWEKDSRKNKSEREELAQKDRGETQKTNERVSPSLRISPLVGRMVSNIKTMCDKKEIATLIEQLQKA